MKIPFTITALIMFGLAGPRLANPVPEFRREQILISEQLVHVDAPGIGESRYKYVPFIVPAHTVRIGISYQYDRAGGSNTIDIGLFDERSTDADTDPRGFRGWSGGRRSEFFVSPNEATPGYLRGPTAQGTWHIILGLYHVAPAGVDVSFKISITTNDGTGSTARSINKSSASHKNWAVPNSPGRATRWWRGDLHMHTIHSDGDWTIDELLSSARNLGLDFICITDHNTSSHHTEIDRLRDRVARPLVLRGEEITTYGGHTNAWGLPSGTWIDFRVLPKDNTGMSKIATAAHRAGALISINHPFALCGGCAWGYDPAVRDFDSIEVWNGEWDLTDELALTMWDKILQSGRHLTAIGSSDSHRAANPIGQPTTHVAAKFESQGALLEGIRKGRVYVSRGVSRPSLTFEANTGNKHPRRWMIGDEIRLRAPTKIRFLVSTDSLSGATISLISNGKVLRSLTTQKDGSPQVVEMECRSDAYYRVEVRDAANAMLALTNPIYVKFSGERR